MFDAFCVSIIIFLRQVVEVICYERFQGNRFSPPCCTANMYVSTLFDTTIQGQLLIKCKFHIDMYSIVTDYGILQL